MYKVGTSKDDDFGEIGPIVGSKPIVPKERKDHQDLNLNVQDIPGAMSRPGRKIEGSKN